jgi:hypothetical protein
VRFETDDEPSVPAEPLCHCSKCIIRRLALERETEPLWLRELRARIKAARKRKHKAKVKRAWLRRLARNA